MGLFNFISNAGAKLFTSAEAAGTEKAENITTFINKMNFDVTDFSAKVDGDTATVWGTATTEVKEKIILSVGNIEGIANVQDEFTVTTPAPDAKFYTVESGDSLSKIAKNFYGDAMKYPVIFEANKPMLADPEKIYPGQTLRIPTEGMPSAQA